MNDWPRPGYTRAGLGPIGRGKYAKWIAAVYKVTKTPNLVVPKPA